MRVRSIILLFFAGGFSLLGAAGKFVPPAGCYIGAFIQNDPLLQSTQYPYGDVARFESLTREHATYLTYIGYGQSFPTLLAAFYASHNAILQIGYEPNNGLDEVQDSQYLREWARAAKKSGAMIFLRWASEMNGNWVAWFGNPTLYKEKWKLVWKVMKEEAPNVAMVWTPNDVPNDPDSPISNPFVYYPGDEYVDWVGIDFYCVYYYENGTQERVDPRQKLKVIYDVYGLKKPIMISEWGVAHNTTRGDTTGIQRYFLSYLDTLYAHLEAQFPNVKSVTYFDYNSTTVDWKLTNDTIVLAGYRKSIGRQHFLGTPYNNIPAITISGIADDEIITASKTITVNANCDGIVDSIVCLLDSIPVQSSRQLPYQMVINGADISKGKHRIRIIAFTHDGTTGFEDRSFIVDKDNEYVNLIIDNGGAGFSTVGIWVQSTSQSDRFGTNYLYTYGGDGKTKAIWKPSFIRSGVYHVYAWWSIAPNRARDAQYTLFHSTGSSTITVNQQTNGGQWNLLTTAILKGDATDSLIITNAATSGAIVVADAARFEWAFEPLSFPERSGDIPVSFALDQNFPNPFNGATIIHYRVAEASLVTLRIYDILGREIAEPFSSMHQAGEYSYHFYSSSLATGIYLYRLESNCCSQSRTMIILK